MIKCCSTEKLIEILNNLGISDEICDLTLLTECLSDSIMFISFIVELEEYFSIEIPDEYLLFSEMECFNDVNNVVNMLLEDKYKGELV